MSWQKCPICMGLGTYTSSPAGMTVKINSKCDVCDGKKMISTITGLPPNSTPEIKISYTIEKVPFKLFEPFEIMKEPSSISGPLPGTWISENHLPGCSSHLRQIGLDEHGTAEWSCVQGCPTRSGAV